MKASGSLWFRSIAVTLVLTMICHDVTWANQGAVSAGFQSALPTVGLVSLPKEVGQVDEIMNSQKDKTSAALVYHIQDAHSVYEAQSNLAKILETLIQKEGVSLILVEGGSGDVNLSSLRGTAWKSVRRRVGEEFLRKGKISGEEYLQVASDYPFELIGIEDSALYRANLDVFLKALRRKPEAVRRLSQIESRIRGLQAELYPSAFRQLEAMRERWQKGEGNLLQYVLTLKGMAREKGIETTSYLEWTKLSNLEKGIEPTSFDQKVFFKELGEIERKVRSKFLINEPSQILWQTGEDLQLLKKLFNFELTSEEYEQIHRSREIINSEKLYSKLSSVSGDRPLASVQKAAQYLEQEKGLFFEFYELAEKRDQTFMRNIERILNEKHPRKAVLITGGFHSNHLGQLFKEKGISRVLISPGITKINESVDSDYEKILREKSKSTLRAPATLGTPYFIELKGVLEREQSRVLEDHIKNLISYLDVDRFLPKVSHKPTASQTTRSELRGIEPFLSVFADLSNPGAAVLWVGLAGLGILGVGLGWYLLKNRKQKARPAETSVPDILPIPSLEFDQEPALEADDNELFGEPEEEPVQILPLRRTPDRPVRPIDPAKAFGAEARRFFEASFPVVPPREDLPPPPYELPLPVPADAIPADQDARGKVAFILQEVLQAMETMDGHMRSQQKESAERALRKILEEGNVDPQKYRSYLQEDLRQFFRGVSEEVKRMNGVPQEAAPLTVSEEIEESHARFPRLVKHLLSENPELLEDHEIKTLMSRISGKFTARPPVAPDLEDYVEQAYRRLNGHPRPQSVVQENVVEPPAAPAPRQPAPRLQPPAPKKKIDSERRAAQLRDLERMREKIEADQRKLSLDIQRAETEHRELQESLNQARQQQDQVIEEALQPSLQAYAARLEKLRSSRDELTARLVQIGTEEERLRGILEEEGGAETARSEMRALPPIFSISIAAAGIGILAAGIAYAGAAYKTHRNASALIQANNGNWPFEWKRIYKETVPVKEEEKLNLLKSDNASPFIGLGVFAGWVIGGIILYHAYYSWDWASKVLFEGAQNYQGKKEPVTLGALLWLLEIFGAPFIGAFLGYVTAFLTQTVTNFVTVAYRTLIFPFDYERALRLHILPYESLSASEIEKSAKFLSRMERETLEVILQAWVERGEHQKIKSFSEKGIWKGDKQKFIHLYEDVAGLEQAKELLVRSFANKDEHKETIAEIVRRWKAALDRKKLNGSRLLKDIIPELVKSEKKFKEIRGWVDRLIVDPMTPWQPGFSQVKVHYEALKQLDRLKEEAVRKFSLNPEDITYLDSQVQTWKGRIPSSASQSTAAVQLLAAVLGKAAQISPNKAWFALSLKKISEIDSALFNPSKQKDLLARFDQVIGFEMMKGRLLGEADAEEKKILVSEFTAIETHLKSKGIDAAVALTTPFIKLRAELPKGHRIAVLQRFRGLEASVYKKEASQASYVFDALTANESAKAKLLALGNGAPQSIREIESKAVLTSVEDINNLSGFYSVLAEKNTPPVQSFVLNLAARAPPGVMPVFIRSRDSLAGYYSAHPTGRDYENLPRLADEYRIQYGSLQILTFPLLDLLTDVGKSPKARLEEARRTIAGQTLVRLGFPENVIETRDAISIEEMIQALSSNGGEELLGKRAKQTVVKKALSKMGRLGLYSYWESARPAYYLQFLEETKGIDPAFFKPGEKIRVSYDGDTPVQRKTGSLSPIGNPVGEMKSLIRTLRLKHPNIYENFIGPKRELLRGKPLEDVIDEKSLTHVASQFKKKVTDWPFLEKEKTDMTLRVHEILFSNELQSPLGQKTAEAETAYWKETLQLFGQKSGLKKDSDLSRNVVALIKKRIDELTVEAGTGREGVVQFILTRGTLSDFVRGEISEDCCSEHRNLHFNDTVGLPTDPAFLSFKLVENGKWIGNIYSMVLKDEEGKFIFYLDNMPVQMSHQTTNAQSKADNLVNGFYPKLKELLEASGFDYFVMAPDPSSREKIRTSLNALGGTSQSKTTSKPGGNGHKSDFEVGSEYVQGLGTLSTSINANGKWITLDNRAAREKRRELEIQELQKILRQTEAERKRLEKLKTEKAAQIKHLKESSQGAAEGSKLATAQVLVEAARKEEVELSRVITELKGLDAQAVSTKARLEGLRTATAIRSELRAISAVLGQILPGGAIEFLVFVSVIGVLGWIGWILLRDWFSGSPKAGEPIRRPETFPSVPKPFDSPIMPPLERPIWHRHPLVIEVTDLFKIVLKRVSDEMRPLMPRRLFFPIPTDMGMKLSEEVVRALTKARTVLKLLRENRSLIPFLRDQPYYRDFKDRALALGLSEDFDMPGAISTFQMKTRAGKEILFSLELSERTSDDLLRGDVSHDCTGLGACAAFYETIPQFLLDPGFLNLKLRMDGKWVGNIYLMVAEREGKPVLVIDAVQFPPAQNAWPIHPIAIAQSTVNHISKWAETQNFDQVVMSSFVSNFTYLYDHFNFQYPRQAMVIEKLGGFEHLKSLGIWDDKNARNQYVETFSPHWNQPLEGVDPNNPKQILYLRPVWMKETPDISQTARSEMRTDQVWNIEGFDLEVPEGDVTALKVIPAGSGSGINQLILEQAFKSESLKIRAAFLAAGFELGMKIRLRVHDDEKGDRNFKFIIVTKKGRRNFILKVDQNKTQFWHEYSEDLNLLDTALMTAQDQGQVVGLRNIFAKSGDPSDLQGHEIPLHGMIYVQEDKHQAAPEKQLKVFDLKIKGHERPSIRAAVKPASEIQKETFAEAKAVYVFSWDEKKYLLGVYEPHQNVKLAMPAPGKEHPEPLASVPEIFEDTSISLMFLTPPSKDNVPPKKDEPEHIVKIPPPQAPEEPKVPEQVVPVYVPEEPSPKPVISETVSSTARAGFVGLGSEIVAQARRIASKARNKKIEEKARTLKAKIEAFKAQINKKSDEVQKAIQELSLEMPVNELLSRIAAIDTEFRSQASDSRKGLEDEIEGYKGIPELEPLYLSLHESAAEIKQSLEAAIVSILEAKKRKVSEKEEFSKSKIQKTAESIIQSVATIRSRIEAISLDLSPREIIDRTRSLEEELVSAIESGLVPIQDEVQSYDLEEIRPVYEGLVTFAEHAQKGILGRLHAFEDETIDSKPESVEETAAEKIPAMKTEAGSLSASPAARSDQEITSHPDLESAIQEMADKTGELEAVKEEIQTLKEQINKQQEETAALEQNRLKILSEIQTLDARKKELETQTAGLEQDKDQKLTLGREIAELGEQIESRRINLRTMTEELSKSQGKQQELIGHTQTLSGEIEQKRKDLGEIENQTEGASRKLQTLKEKITESDHKVSTLSEKEDRLQTVNRQLEAQEEKLTKKRQQIEESSRLLGQGRGALKALGDETENRRKVLQGLSQSVRDLKEQITLQNKELTTLRKNQTQITGDIERLTSQKQVLEQKLLEKSGSERSVLIEEIGRLDRELEAKRDALQPLVTELSATEERLLALKEEKESLAQNVEELQRNLTSLETLRTQAQADYEQIQAALSQAKGNLNQLPAQEQRLVDVTQELVQKELTLLQKEEALSRAGRQIEEKTAAIQDLDRQLIVKSEETGTRSKELQTLEERLTRNAQTAQELNSQLSLLKDQVGTLEAKKNALERELAEAGALKGELDQARQDLQETLKEKEQVQADYNKILADGIAEDERLRSLEKQVTEAGERIQTLRTDIAQLEEKEKRHQTLLAETSEQEKKLEQTRVSLSDLLRQKEEASREHEQILRNQQTVQGETTQTRDDLETLKKQKEEIQSDLGTLEQTRIELLGEVKTLEEKDSRLKQLEADLGKASKDLSSMEASTQRLTEQLRRMDESQNRQAERLTEMQREKNELLEQLKGEQEAKRTVEDELGQLKAELESMTDRLETEPPIQGQLRVDTDRLTQRLAEYLSIPSGSGQEEKLRDHLLKELEQFGGKVIFLADQKPLNLVWDIPASEGYEGSLKKIGLNAHIDRVTHTRTRVSRKDGFVHAEGEGGTAGFDDMLGVAAIMEVLETVKEKNIPHPHLRIIFTAEEESSSDGKGPWGGARWLVDHRPELLKDLDLLVPIDGPVLNSKTGGQDPDSPLAVKFINFEGPERVKSDSIYQRVLAEGSALGGLVRDVLNQAAMLGVLAAGAAIVKHQPKEFNFSGGDEREFQRIKGLRIAHLRVNYQHPSGHGPKDSVKTEHLMLLAEWLLRITEGLKTTHVSLKTKETPSASQKQVKIHETEGKTFPEEKPAPVATKTLEKEKTSPVTAPLKTEVSERLKPALIKISSLEHLIEMISESIQFSYERRLSTGEEFIINFPGQPLRWIAFQVEELEWKLYEKDGHGVKSYPLFETDRETQARGGNIDLSKIEVEISPTRRDALAKFLSPPSFMPAQDVIFPEAGGFVLKDETGKMVVMPFLKKGIAPISENGAARGVGFFVHPGGIPVLESKDKSLSIPFATSEYDVLHAQNPKTKFVLGWHTNPGGPAKLHPVEEKEMMRKGIAGMHLVVTPAKLALWDYSGIDKQKPPRLLFEAETPNVSEWSKQLTIHLNHAHRKGEGLPSSGYQLRDGEKELLEEALERGEKFQSRNIKPQIQKLYFDLGTSYGLEAPGLEAFIEHSEFNLVVVKPEGQRGERAPPMGLGVKLSKPGRDLFATFDLAPKEARDGYEVTIYVGHGIYELAEEKERLEILAHELYQAYRIAYDDNPRNYPLDIDLELKIDEEIRRSQGWEPRIPLAEREDLGLLGGIEKRTDAHVRSRAFARLLGSPSSDGIGTTYTKLLRHAYALARRFAEGPHADDARNVVPPPAHDAFSYTQDSFQNVVSAEGLQRLFEMSAYVHENKEEELTDFLEKKIEEGKNLLLLNQNAPTPWILKDTRKIIEDLAADGKLKQIFVDLPPRLQSQIDQYLEIGRSSQELLTAIASRFPSFLPKEFERPDLYESILRAVYEHNLEAGNGGKIRVTAYYQGRQLPPMPQHGNFPQRPGDMPFRQPGEQPFQAPPGFGERGAQPPIMPRPGELPFLPLPQLPLTRGVKEAFQKALSEAERNRNSAVLFLKPLDEFFPEELNNHAGVASILHIDKYTGYGPEKPENQLALYMSEQASPNQKSFALPILAEAPFYEESVNPGVPRGLRFNEFNVYPDLILSTAGDGDDSLEPTPDEVVPEEIGPLVPVGGGRRSELRLVSPNAVPVLNQRETALKELIQIGEPAVGPLVNVLALPSVTLRLGAIQALGGIGDPRAIGPLNQVAQVAELREAAKLAVQSIQTHPRTLNATSAMSKEANTGNRVKHHHPLEIPSSAQGVYEPLAGLNSQKSVSFIQTLLKQTPLAVDLDVESLMRKDNNGRISLSGWGFTEVLKTLEAELPDEFFERIRIRLVNLNPQIRPEEIERAFGITPELRRMVEIISVPVRHTAFKGIEAFLEKDALKIASERNQSLWNNHADILVKEPGKDELIDGRKLFLAALLHQTLRSRISKELKAVAIRLLRQIGDLPTSGMSYFNADSRNGFSLEFLNGMERANRMLASMA